MLNNPTIVLVGLDGQVYWNFIVNMSKYHIKNKDKVSGSWVIKLKIGKVTEKPGLRAALHISISRTLSV